MFIELQLYCGLIERILIIYSHASLSLSLSLFFKKKNYGPLDYS